MWFPGGHDEFDAVVREALPAQVERNLGAFLLRFRDSFVLVLPMWWMALSVNASAPCWDCWAYSTVKLVLELVSLWAYCALQMAGVVWMASYAQERRARLDVGVSYSIAVVWALLVAGQDTVDSLRYKHDGLLWQCGFVLFVSSQAILAKAILSTAGFRGRQAGGGTRSDYAPAGGPRRARPAVEMQLR